MIQGFSSFATITASILILALLSAGAVAWKILTPAAALVAAIAGFALFLLGGLPYLTLALFFVMAGAATTRYGFEEKKAMQVSEGKGGERGVGNVVAHVSIPLSLVVGFYFSQGELSSLRTLIPFLYTSAIAFGAADTFASEIGVLSDQAVSILGGEKVNPGENGGISIMGEMAALGGSFLVSLVGGLLFLAFGFPWAFPILSWIAVSTILGWVGCQVDSLVGATLEKRGWIGKNSVNLLAMGATTLLALGVISL